MTKEGLISTEDFSIFQTNQRTQYKTTGSILKNIGAWTQQIQKKIDDQLKLDAEFKRIHYPSTFLNRDVLQLHVVPDGVTDLVSKYALPNNFGECMELLVKYDHTQMLKGYIDSTAAVSTLSISMATMNLVVHPKNCTTYHAKSEKKRNETNENGDSGPEDDGGIAAAAILVMLLFICKTRI